MKWHSCTHVPFRKITPSHRSQKKESQDKARISTLFAQYQNSHDWGDRRAQRQGTATQHTGEKAAIPPNAKAPSALRAPSALGPGGGARTTHRHPPWRPGPGRRFAGATCGREGAPAIQMISILSARLGHTLLCPQRPLAGSVFKPRGVHPVTAGKIGAHAKSHADQGSVV